MTKYFARACPGCNAYLEIVLLDLGYKVAHQTVNGRCLECGYRLAWIVMSGGKTLPAGSRLRFVSPANERATRKTAAILCRRPCDGGCVIAEFSRPGPRRRDRRRRLL